jgi:transaldolase
MMLSNLNTRVFADGADLKSIIALASDPRIAGFTTNPTLMRKAGLTEYSEFARRLLAQVPEHSVSFEVLADDADEILRQAKLISGWGDNVYAKIPVTTTNGESTATVVRSLSESGVKVNVTAVFTLPQVESIVAVLANGAPAYISVFAGRIADAGVDPLPIISAAVNIMEQSPQAELIWASSREILNLTQANSVGCHIITLSPDLLNKLDGLGKNLELFSLETVRMFRQDALAAGLTL